MSKQGVNEVLAIHMLNKLLLIKDKVKKQIFLGDYLCNVGDLIDNSLVIICNKQPITRVKLKILSYHYSTLPKIPIDTMVHNKLHLTKDGLVESVILGNGEEKEEVGEETIDPTEDIVISYNLSHTKLEQLYKELNE